MNNSKQLMALNLSRLRNDDFLSLSEKTMMILESAGDNIEPVILTIAKKIKLDLQQFKQSIKRPRASLFTAKINELDKIRNQETKEIVRRVKYFSISGTTVQKEPAKILQQILKAYQNLRHQHINTETAVLQTFFSEINQNQMLRNTISTLALTDVFVKLEALNQEIDQLSIQRAKEKQNKPIYTGVEAKKILLKTYQNLCNTLEGVVQLNADSTLYEIFEQLNVYRKEYHTLLLATRHKKPAKELAVQPFYREVSADAEHLEATVPS